MIGLLQFKNQDEGTKRSMFMDYNYAKKPSGEHNALLFEVPVPDAKELAISINDEIESCADKNRLLPPNIRVNIIVLRRVLQYFEKLEAADIQAQEALNDHITNNVTDRDPLQCDRCGIVCKSLHGLKVHKGRNVPCLRAMKEKIKILNFGEEDTSYVTDDLLQLCTQDLPSGVSMLIEHVFMNNAHQANLNTRKIDDLTEHVLIDGKWTIQNTKDILIKKAQKMADLISDYNKRMYEASEKAKLTYS